MLLGAIADDLTGASDLALMLSREGMRTIQTIGVPTSAIDLDGIDAIVVALKSRTTPAADAVEKSLDALAWLREVGAKQFLLKYCSTFDSTTEGNIGPVTDALMDELGCEMTIVCPAFPRTGRTIYKGHLFVGDQLLSDSPMRHHPLTPMTDASLIRLMAAQSRRQVGLIAHDVVARGAAAIRMAMSEARLRAEQILVIDALSDEDLRAIGEAVDGLSLITGGSGIAIGLPANYRGQGLLSGATAASYAAPLGRAAILAGSCSQATRAQISFALKAGMPAMKLDPLEIAAGSLTPDQAISWAMRQGAEVPLIYSSADPEDVLLAQKKLGRDEAGALIEDFLARVAVGLGSTGVCRLIVAGGETSGAVVNSLAPAALLIGPEIDPGVPWTRTIGRDQEMALALKSGNFGAEDFFVKAWEHLQ